MTHGFEALMQNGGEHLEVVARTRSLRMLLNAYLTDIDRMLTRHIVPISGARGKWRYMYPLFFKWLICNTKTLALVFK